MSDELGSPNERRAWEEREREEASLALARAWQADRERGNAILGRLFYLVLAIVVFWFVFGRDPSPAPVERCCPCSTTIAL